MKGYYSKEIKINDEFVEIEIEYNITPIIPASYWYPAEGGEVEILSVKRNDNDTSIELPTDIDKDALYIEISENHEWDDGYDYD